MLPETSSPKSIVEGQCLIGVLKSKVQTYKYHEYSTFLLISRAIRSWLESEGVSLPSLSPLSPLSPLSLPLSLPSPLSPLFSLSSLSLSFLSSLS